MKKSMVFIGTSILAARVFSQAWIPLEEAPKKVEQYKEILITYNPLIPSQYNALSSEERIFMYYLFRSGLPGNRIASDQLHRDAIFMTELLQKIVENEQILKTSTFNNLDIDTFLKQVKIYLVFLWANHSPYFLREFVNHKRTCENLHLDAVTYENLLQVLQKTKNAPSLKDIEKIKKSMFDASDEPTLTIPGKINESAVNIYAKDFSDTDFNQLSFDKQKSINAYYCLENGIPTRKLYKIGGKYDEELQVSSYWIKKAYVFAKKYPQYFDDHLVQSLYHLINFIHTGDEEDFKLHSTEWLQSNSKIDYCWGFIETYKDPKAYTGLFQSETTIKYLDMQNLQKLLPKIEEKLPFPAEYKRNRENMFLPNVSINVQITASGDLGPMKTVAAYCLPNYDEIRSTIGSKQIIYPTSLSLYQKINPELSKQLLYLSEEVEWFEKNDPEFQLPQDLWILHVLLHETIGHGSGKYFQHTFQEGENLTVEGKAYKIGDTISVTSTNIQPLLSPYSATLEELRAEILALYASIEFYDDLVNIGFLDKWSKKIPKDKMLEMLILDMAKTALKKFFDQKTEIISGDHARANCTIMYYLIEKGAIELVEEKKQIDGSTYTVIGLRVLDLEKAKKAVLDLAILVQQIKSTADGMACKKLVEKYGVNSVQKQHIRIQKANRDAIAGDLKAEVSLFPTFIPIRDKRTKEITDIQAKWPDNIFEQQQEYASLSLSYEN